MGCNGSKQQQQQQAQQALVEHFSGNPNLLQTPAAPNADAAAKAAVADVAPEVRERVQKVSAIWSRSQGDYKVTLERASADESLGLTIIGDANGAFKVQVVKDEGMVPAYNKKPETPLEQQVKVGDMIVAVNSVFRDLVAMKKQLAEQSLVLSVKRQQEAQQKAAEAAPAVAVGETQPAAVVDTTENAAATGGVVEDAQGKAVDAAAATEEPPAAVAEPAAVDADAVAAASSSSEAAAAPEEEAVDAPVAGATTLGEAPPAIQNDEGFVPVVPEELETNLEGGKCSVCGC